MTLIDLKTGGDERVKQQTGDGRVDDGIYLSSDARSHQEEKPVQRRWQDRFVWSSILSGATADDGCRQMLEPPTQLRPTISQRSHLMPIISSHHTVVFIIVTLLHSLFTSGIDRYTFRDVAPILFRQ